MCTANGRCSDSSVSCWSAGSREALSWELRSEGGKRSRSLRWSQDGRGPEMCVRGHLRMCVSPRGPRSRLASTVTAAWEVRITSLVLPRPWPNKVGETHGELDACGFVSLMEDLRSGERSAAPSHPLSPGAVGRILRQTSRPVVHHTSELEGAWRASN